MIIDRLNNCDLYQGLHKDFSKVFEILKTLGDDVPAEKIVIDDGNAWVFPPCVLTDITDSKHFEAHNDFIDIHYIISGIEKFGYANREDLKTVQEYDNKQDYELLDGKGEFFTLKTGDFCVVYPQDAHMPAYQNLGEENLVRIVAKIRL